jgi:hypothetical protein
MAAQLSDSDIGRLERGERRRRFILPMHGGADNVERSHSTTYVRDWTGNRAERSNRVDLWLALAEVSAVSGS